MQSFYSNPLSRISVRSQKFTLWFFGSFTVFLFIIINIVDQPLRNSIAPDGIVSFELAGNYIQSQNILQSWDAAAHQFAAFSLGIDYLFLVAYSLFFFLVIIQLSQRFIEKYPSIFRIGFYLAYAQFIAALFDGIENYFLIRLLFGAESNTFSQLAFYFASLKFLIIGSGILYILFSLIFFAFFQRKNTFHTG